MPPVIVTVCFNKGHNIISHVIGQNYDPVMKVMFSKFEFRCTQCGKTPKEIESYRPGGAPKQRKVKTNEHNRNSNSPAVEASEASETVPVASSEFNLPEPGVPSGSDPENRAE